MNTKHELLNISKGFILGITVILGMSAIAWNGPVSAPPNYNAYAPINISAASQTKDGALWAGSFLTTGGGYFGGNVGIGTSNPAQKLSVVGTIESTSGGVKFPDGTTQTTAAGGGGITECRICFQETEGSNQCQYTRSSCSGWSGSPDWTSPFRDDTDGGSGGCVYQWKIECR